jgi:drug/metabolite transporter (DMT)-like permease
MPLLALALLVISAFLHALWNLLLKRSKEKYIAMGWQVLLSGAFAFILLLIVGLPPRSMWIFAVISMALEAVYFILLSNAYTDNDFSVVYPIARGTAPAFVMFWSVVFLHEELTPGGMITIGATSLVQNPRSKLHLKVIILPLTVALIISFYTLVDGDAVKNGSPLSFGLMMFMMIPILTTLYNLRRYGW